MKNRMLNSYKSLSNRERALTKSIFIATPALIFSIYFFSQLMSIQENKNQLSISQNNFNYVFEKASNFKLFSASQKKYLRYPITEDFLIAEASKFGLTDFRLVNENNQAIIYFNDISLKNSLLYVESIANHPTLSIEAIKIIPANNVNKIKIIYYSD